jgi:hypothetical protein
MSDSQPAVPTEAPARGRFAAFAAGAGIFLVRLAGDALLVDAAWETWRGGAPERAVVALVVAAFVLLTLWVLSQGGRIGGRGWLTDPAAPYIVFLGLLVYFAGSRDTVAHGLLALGRRTDALLAASLLALVALGLWRFSGPGGVRSTWLRLVVAALGVYAAWSLGMAVAAGTGLAAVVAGDSAWRGAPIWLRGGQVGAFVVLPLAWFHEFADAMTRLTLAGLLRWLIVFALGVGMAARVAWW